MKTTQKTTTEVSADKRGGGNWFLIKKLLLLQNQGAFQRLGPPTTDLIVKRNIAIFKDDVLLGRTWKLLHQTYIIYLKKKSQNCFLKLYVVKRIE